MKDVGAQMTAAAKTSAKVAMLFGKRLQHANEQYRKRLQDVTSEMAQAQPRPQDALQSMVRCANYAIDAVQRSVLVADTLRERGNNFIAHEQAGKPPLLHFEFDDALDAAATPRALLRGKTPRKAARKGARK